MPPKAAGDLKRRATPRRKVALACDSCREKKIRCDGKKPVCGPCGKRAHRVDQCVYNTDPVRSASRDEYYHTLHQRIRELESACLEAGVSIAAPSGHQAQPQCENPSGPIRHDEVPTATEPLRLAPAAAYPPLEPAGQNLTPTSFATGVPLGHQLPAAHSERGISQAAGSTAEETTDSYESPLFGDEQGHITGMGQVTAPDAESRRRFARFQFYGSSSTASLMRFAWQSMPLRSASASRAEPALNALQDTSTDYRFDDFALPPRELADHLVTCFFDHVYILYPFFHRPAFESAYRNLWRAEDESKISLTDAHIGLGSSAESGPRSIVFHSALNMIFALGCQFADIVPEEVEPVANSFFLRGKRFIGLDFLDINTLGVVQTLLITALLLQSSPYPSRCWHSVGVACRVALGLGLHESDILTSVTPLESDIRRRTWHGCVMMDVTLSMTYGRPSMTTHIAPLPPPAGEPERTTQEPRGNPSLMAFYTETIKLYDILDRILSDVYYVWRSRSRRDNSQHSTRGLGGLDTVLEIERQLTLFEANLPSFLKWTTGQHILHQNPERSKPIAQQRNVLHARYIHLHLLLYRPIFTQLYSETVQRRESASGTGLQTEKSTLYSSMASKCAAACVMAAVDLTHLVHETYQTSATDAWWYNGFYVSTAAVVLLISFSAPSMLDAATTQKARHGWEEATNVLKSMATFRQSARNTLQFLQAAYRQAVPAGEMQHAIGTTGVVGGGGDIVGGDAAQFPGHIAQGQETFDRLDHDFLNTPLFSWEEYAANMGQGQGLGQGLDDLGFLTRLDFPDSLG
ncbi:fungal-specific transcription factor domain-containing protein [Aspergillus keveii]|uniref:Fungal-specific transcription factor domain-containing protein n=1 Tax=Aspergillus keveii TaxID=714993 RepID=A0ABR4GEG5_9EURO